jgi:hypothetical protein
MNKVLFSALFLFLSTNIFAQDEYIIHNGKKETLKIVKNTVVIKYINGYNINNIEDLISGTFGYEIISENKFKDEAVILNLRSDFAQEKLSLLHQYQGIEYAGYGYKGTGNVIHYPTNEILVRYKSYLS